MKYAARIIEGPDLFARNVVRLAIRDEARNAFLMPDGTWQTVPEGEYIADMGVVLPAGAVEAIAVAVAEYQGHTSHADTEARVLREALTVERARVDRMLDR
jgi:hypothetical protein